MTFESFVALRQLRSGRSGSLSVISGIAVAGVVLAVAALVTVMSVTGGFQRLFREKVLGLNAHILIMRYGLDFKEYREVMERALQVPQVEGASPFVFYEMMVSAGDVLAGVMVKGIDPRSADRVSDLRRYLQPGPGALERLAEGHDQGTPSVILGRELAGKLGVGVGDQVLLVSPQRGSDATQLSSREQAPSSTAFNVVAIHSSGFYEYDSRLVFVDYRALQRFLQLGDTVTGVELKVSDIFGSRAIGQQVRVRLGDQRYSVTPWVQGQLERFEVASTQRARLRWAWMGGLLVLLATALVLLLRPSPSARVARGVAAALLVTVAAAGALLGWRTEWGVRYLAGPELGLDPHVVVRRDNGDFLEYRNALAEARVLDGVDRVGATISGRAATLLPDGQGGERPGPTLRLRGYDSEAETLPVRRYLVDGSTQGLVPPMLPELRMPPYRILIGRGLARSLGVQVGSRFRIRPLSGVADAPLPEQGPYAVEVAGLLETGDPEHDSSTVFLDFLAARRILSLVDAAEGVEVWLRDPLRAQKAAAELSSRLGGHSYRTLDWKEINHNIFRSLELQKQSLSLVLFVITVVAALNIISTLVLMVIDKGHQIAILKAMGATGSAVMRIFVIQGFSIGLMGTGAGLALGWGACRLLASIRFPLQAEVYLIEYLPVDVAVSDFAIAGVAALLVSLWATIYPAIRAASLTPVEGMRDL